MPRRFRRRWFPPSSPQQNKLLHYVRFLYPTALRNHRVRIAGMRKSRWVDIGIVERKIAVEYDGQQHFTKEGKIKDKVRDAELVSMGWRVIHVNKNNWKFFLEHMRAVVEGEITLARTQV
jgi:very-short-patch-repair endonuclease